MSQPKLRRALAVLALTFATAFALAPEAGAAVQAAKTGAAHARAAQRAGASRLLRKVGITIDPNGLIDRLIQSILPDGCG
jgi:hypothetical protein